MAVNKVVYGNQTVIDLTADTATAADVKLNKTFHTSDGILRMGLNSESGAAVTVFDTELIQDEDYLLNLTYQDAQRIIDVLPDASSTAHGLMSTSDKALLDASTQTFHWTPKIYDHETYLFDAPQQEYFKLGKLKIFSARFQVQQARTIGTMLQIRNVPCSVILGGNVYIANSAVGHVIQGLAGTNVYPRPNFIGNLTASAWITAIIFAY